MYSTLFVYVNLLMLIFRYSLLRCGRNLLIFLIPLNGNLGLLIKMAIFITKTFTEQSKNLKETGVLAVLLFIRLIML